jgi:uncharacterized spore protein YtfJ
LLNAKNVLGDPIEKNGSTVISIVSYGFGFGAGGTKGTKSGDDGGTGGGGGIKPICAIIIDEKGARVEAIKGAMSGLTEVLGDAAAHAIAKKGKRIAKRGLKWHYRFCNGLARPCWF